MTTVDRRSFILAVGAAALSGARIAHAAPSLDEALAAVGKARDGLRTVVGPFTQERTIGLLSTKVKSTGTLSLARPDRLRWELAAPDSVVYWVGPEGLAYKSARGGQGRLPPTQARVAAALEDLRTVLAGDLAALRERYELALAAESEAGAFAFTATPRDKSAKLKRVDFTLDAKTAAPRRVVLVEGAKDKTDIVFGSLALNVEIPADALRPSF